MQSDLFRGLPHGSFPPLPPTREAFPARLKAEAPALPEPPAMKLLRRQSTVASPELYAVLSLVGDEALIREALRAAGF